MKTQLTLCATALSVVLSGCATVDSFDDSLVNSESNLSKEVRNDTEIADNVETNNSDESVKDSAVVDEDKDIEGKLVASSSSVIMPSAIKPESGNTYIRKIDTKTGRVSASGEYSLKAALDAISDHSNIELMDNAANLRAVEMLSVSGMDVQRFILVVERVFDVEITDHGSRLSVAGVINGVIDLPNSDESFQESAYQYLTAYSPNKPTLVTRIADGKYSVSGSPNAVKSLMKADNSADFSGQQVMVDILIRTPNGDLKQIQFLIRTEGESTAPIEGGSVTVKVSADADHQLSSNVSFVLDGMPSQKYEVIQQSGNRLPLTFGTEAGIYEIAYMVKLISQIYGK